MTIAWSLESLLKAVQSESDVSSDTNILLQVQTGDTPHVRRTDLQEYINHDATIFKIYSLNGVTSITQRISLPNFPVPNQVTSNFVDIMSDLPAENAPKRPPSSDHIR